MRSRCLNLMLSGLNNEHSIFQSSLTGHFEFHVSGNVRKKYEFDHTLFSSTGNVVFADFQAARLLAQQINKQRDLERFPEQAVKAGQINAMGLIDEILHHVVFLYQRQINPKAFEQALKWVETEVNEKEIDKVLTQFIEQFPPRAVYKNQLDARTYLKESTNGILNRLIAFEEMVLLWLANRNPAFSTFQELFDDSLLRRQTAYLQVMQSIEDFFKTQPLFGPDKLDLISLLRQSAIEAPDSLEGQLTFMRSRWGLIFENFLSRLIGGLDLIREETKPIFAGPGPTQVPEFFSDIEFEKFSSDLEWMPRLVLIAKSTLVWLDQLSKKYKSSITRLDQIPDQELDDLTRWGFTGLWLIGIWERSPASKKIKQMCGNPEAEASAYALFDYEIAVEIGGYKALQNLKYRCLQRGIRLASDMVPNHTGIDSKWVRENPDWFVSLPNSPFPSYTFNGTNLSTDPRYGIFIEDNYYSRTDAAVVFKKQDYWTGDVKYIYHGNDGTNMPWNDTAQLNFLNPEVREAVIQNILRVAHSFSIIRFDAAMTLTKKHYQRLWFPAPGSGGDIPTRSEHGLSKGNFNKAMTNEFWREVVDRIAEEAPDTLLLAEAFWLMEGYFVRTLGMHRVYNSAFMNMLKNEENEKYRNTVKNTLQFNPEILKRFVNFMNNPDEETALAQFGKSDKYFGVCTMVVTMPGLPMFGHGQVEGFVEKYGMEYRRAYLDEQVDWELVDRHEREIFPLMKKRYLFANVDDFLFYDFSTEENVNENVFAYSNRFGNEYALVVYNNKFAEAKGWIQTSVQYASKTGTNGDTHLKQKNLGSALNLHSGENNYCIFQDEVTGLEFIRKSNEILQQGLYFELGAYKYFVALNFREVLDNDLHQYEQLAASLNGSGVASISEALQELFLQPLSEAFDSLLSVGKVKEFKKHSLRKKSPAGFLKNFEKSSVLFLKQARHFSSGTGNKTILAEEILRKLKILLRLPEIKNQFGNSKSPKFQAAVKYLKKGYIEYDMTFSLLLSWLVTHSLGKLVSQASYEEQSRILLSDWLLSKRFTWVLRQLGADENESWEGGMLLKILVSEQNWFLETIRKKGQEDKIMSQLLKSSDIRKFLKVNRWESVLWFNKENFQKLVWWLFLISVIQIESKFEMDSEEAVKEIEKTFATIQNWLKAEKTSEYQLEKLLNALKK